MKRCICLRCGHKWWPRKPGRPALCPWPRCHSTRWDEPRPTVQAGPQADRPVEELQALTPEGAGEEADRERPNERIE